MAFNKISDIEILDIFKLSNDAMEEQEKKCLCDKSKGVCVNNCKCKVHEES